MTWRLMAWSELLKSRKAHKAEILRSYKNLPQQDKDISATNVGDIILNFFDPAPENGLSASIIPVSKVPAADNGTNGSGAIDWSKL
jgi:hypothetical protein